MNSSFNYDDNQWELEKDFCKDNIVVRVTKLRGHRTRYSIQVCRINDLSKHVPFFYVFYNKEDGIVKIRNPISNDVALLLAEAETYVEQLYQDRENEIKKTLYNKDK